MLQALQLKASKFLNFTHMPYVTSVAPNYNKIIIRLLAVFTSFPYVGVYHYPRPQAS